MTANTITNWFAWRFHVDARKRLQTRECHNSDRGNSSTFEQTLQRVQLQQVHTGSCERVADSGACASRSVASVAVEHPLRDADVQCAAVAGMQARLDGHRKPIRDAPRTSHYVAAAASQGRECSISR